MSNLAISGQPTAFTFAPALMNTDSFFEDAEHQSDVEEQMFLASVEKCVAADIQDFVSYLDRLSLFDRAHLMLKTREALASMI